MSRGASVQHVRRSRAGLTGFERAATLILAVLACLLAHQVSYHIRYGSGPGYASAMSLRGHDAYWSVLTIGVAITIGVLIGMVVRDLLRLRREADGAPVVDEAGGLCTFASLVGRTWLRLAGLTVVLYTAQENAEAVLSGQPAPALGALLGDGAIAALAVVAISFVVALVAALARWRRLVLLGRIRAAATHWPRVRATRAPVVSDAPSWSDHLVTSQRLRAPPVGASLPA